MSKQAVVKTVEEKYKKYEILAHILALPDTCLLYTSPSPRDS